MTRATHLNFSPVGTKECGIWKPRRAKASAVEQLQFSEDIGTYGELACEGDERRASFLCREMTMALYCVAKGVWVLTTETSPM